MDDITIPKAEYDELRARPTRDELNAEVAKRTESEQAIEKAEATAAQSTQRAEKAEGEVASLREEANKATLRDERMNGLGTGFVAKLGEKTKARLHEQAGLLEDAEWAARLDELQEAYGVAPDAKADENDPASTATTATSNGGQSFSAEEIARLQVSGKTQDGATVDPAQTRSVIGALMAKKNKTGASR